MFGEDGDQSMRFSELSGEDLDVLLEHGVVGETCVEMVAGAFGFGTTPVSAPQQAPQHGRADRGIIPRDQMGTFAEGETATRKVAGDHRAAGGHGFEDGVGAAFAAAEMQGDRRCPEEIGGVVDLSQIADVAGQTQVLDEVRAGLPPVVGPAGEDEEGTGVGGIPIPEHPMPGMDGGHRILGGGEIRHHHHQGSFRGKVVEEWGGGSRAGTPFLDQVREQGDPLPGDPEVDQVIERGRTVGEEAGGGG